MTDSTGETLVIGLGSPLMGDDGAGLAALALLREGWRMAPGVELVDGGTWGMNLLPILERATRVIFLDAVHSGNPPGTVVEMEGLAIPHLLRHKLSPHQIDLSEVLALAIFRETMPHDLRVVGVEPLHVEMSTTLSPTVADALSDMVALVVRRLGEAGFHARRLHEEASCTS